MVNNLELGSVLDVSLNDWNKELSAGQTEHVLRSMAALSTNAEPTPGTTGVPSLRLEKAKN